MVKITGKMNGIEKTVSVLWNGYEAVGYDAENNCEWTIEADTNGLILTTAENVIMEGKVVAEENGNTLEHCPYCETLVEISASKVSACPSCEMPLFPCSACPDLGKESCVWNEAHTTCKRFPDGLKEEEDGFDKEPFYDYEDCECRNEMGADGMEYTQDFTAQDGSLVCDHCGRVQ